MLNRKSFEIYLADIYNQYKREKNRGSLFYLDLDNFKEINDTYGHHYGDIVLKELSKRFIHVLRKTDKVFRIGGDEFAVITRNVKGKKTAEVIANKICRKLIEPVRISGKEFIISTSIGITFFDNKTESCEMLLPEADKAMYDAKKKGGNSFHFFQA